PLDRREAVAEVRFGRRADAHPGAGVLDELELGVGGVGRMDDRGARAEAAGLGQELDRAEAVLGDALLDLSGLLVGVDVEGQPLAFGVAADLLEPVAWTGADGVGGEADAGAAAGKALDLREVLRDGVLSEAGEPAAGVGGEEEDELDPGLARGLDRGMRLSEPEVVELAHRRVAGVAHLGVGLYVLGANGVGRLPLRELEHDLAPGPEVAALRAPAERALERVAVRIDETRERERLGGGHRGRIVTLPALPRTPPVTPAA